VDKQIFCCCWLWTRRATNYRHVHHILCTHGHLQPTTLEITNKALLEQPERDSETSDESLFIDAEAPGKAVEEPEPTVLLVSRFLSRSG